MPDGNTTVILQGKKRFEIESVTSEDPYLTASIKDFPENRPEQTDTEFLAILESIKESNQIIKKKTKFLLRPTFAIKNIESQSFLINFVTSNMNLSVKEKQGAINDLKERALETLRYMILSCKNSN
jgi:ATP-dependent Lon protease